MPVIFELMKLGRGSSSSSIMFLLYSRVLAKCNVAKNACCVSSTITFDQVIEIFLSFLETFLISNYQGDRKLSAKHTYNILSASVVLRSRWNLEFRKQRHLFTKSNIKIDYKFNIKIIYNVWIFKYIN